MTEDQVLISLPPAIAPHFDRLENRGSRFFACSDPVPLGSGGGTAHLLYQAWKTSGASDSIWEWLRTSRKIVIHSGGQSRRLPAYAATGKALMPIPIERGSLGQSFDQTLLDLQLVTAGRVLAEAPEEFRVLVMSGDVLLKIAKGPLRIGNADVACLGFECSPTDLQNFGAFFMRWDSPEQLDFALQKPSIEVTARWSRERKYVADAGVWLLNERATKALFHKVGWQDQAGDFSGGVPRPVDLYGEFGLEMGENPPSKPDAHLSAAIFQPGCQFFHFGTTRQVLEATTRLHQSATALAGSESGFLTTELRHSNQHVQNVHFAGGQNLPRDRAVWIENAFVSQRIDWNGNNFVTGLTNADWSFSMPQGACLDIVPVSGFESCIRIYGFDDPFRGPIGLSRTLWMNESLARWFDARELTPYLSALDQNMDIQEAPLFPILPNLEITSDLLQWLLSGPGTSPRSGIARERWLSVRKLSASDCLVRADVSQIYAHRAELRRAALRALAKRRDSNTFYTMDLKRAAQLAAPDIAFPQLEVNHESRNLAQSIRDDMFESELHRLQGNPNWEESERRSFHRLKQMIVDPAKLAVQAPVSDVLEQQIVWGRSPVRLDLAGGWTDTPPYSILRGGRVVNVAVELNGQPPIQVFVRVTQELRIVLRSIDLGTHFTLDRFEDLEAGVMVGSEFALAKTALALSGFLPAFCRDAAPSLKATLNHFGGGLEVSMIAAVPKGSGLGTSSVLSATLLATLGSISGHCWSDQDIYNRVLASEQILTTGGGWQDQVGGATPGLKLVSTEPGLSQQIQCRWLPHAVFAPDTVNQTALLYYTGITRSAKGVLKEIVRGMFLNAGQTVETLEQIGEHTQPTADAAMRGSYQDLGTAVRRSWEQNCKLDSGTSPPAIEHIYRMIDDHVLGAKLLGAGGGGYMLLFCKDLEAARAVRRILGDHRAHPGSRFVDFQVSAAGLTVTRS